MAEKINKIIDFRDSLSTISLLKVSQVFGKMNPSEVLEIRGADPEIREDLFKVLPREAYEIIDMAESGIGDAAEGLRIRKCR